MTGRTSVQSRNIVYQQQKATEAPPQEAQGRVATTEARAGRMPSQSGSDWFSGLSQQQQSEVRQFLQQRGLDPKLLDTSNQGFLKTLTTNDRVVLREISSALTAGTTTTTSSSVDAGLQGRWSNFIADQNLRGGIDVNALVQIVLREAYMENTKDLMFFAEKVRFYNEMKKKIREELTRARKERSKYAGLDDDARLVPAFMPVEIDTTYYGAKIGTDLAVSQEELTDVFVDLDGDGIGFMLPASLAKMGGVEEAIAMLSEREWGTDPYATHTGCRTGQNTPSNLANSPHITLALYSILQGGERLTAEQLQARLLAEFGIESQVVTITGDDGRQLAGLEFANGARFADGNGDGKIAEVDYNFTDALAAIKDQYNVDPESFAANAPDFQSKVQEAVGGFSSNEQAFKDDVANIMALAYMFGAGDAIDTVGELDTYIKNMEEKLNSVGDDAQLANVDLQNMLQKQQQTLQMMSNISKMLNDTAMAVIRKIGS